MLADPCMEKIYVPFGVGGPYSLLNVICLSSFAFHPIVLTKLLTLLMYCSACFHGIIAWEDSNPREGFGFSMLAGQIFGRLYTYALQIVLYFWALLWVFTGSFVFSVLYAPICICGGLGWLMAEAILFSILSVAQTVEECADFVIAEREKKDIDEKLEKLRETIKPNETSDLEKVLRIECERYNVDYEKPEDDEAEKMRRRRQERLKKALERTIDGRNRYFGAVPTLVIRTVRTSLVGVKDSLWWLGNNERPRGSQLITAFGLSLFLDGCYGPLRGLASRRSRSGAAVGRPQLRLKPKPKKKDASFCVLAVAASASTDDSPSAPASPPPSPKGPELDVRPRLASWGQSIASRSATTLAQAVSSTKSALDKEAESRKSSRGHGDGDDFAFSEEDVGKQVRIRRGAIRVSASEAVGRCSRWEVRLADWDPQRLLPRQRGHFMQLDGVIESVTDGKLRGTQLRSELPFELDNPPRAYHAAFSRLLFQIALPILIVAPTVLYGVITAFYTYQTLVTPEGSLAMGNMGARLGSRKTLFDFLYEETFRVALPPHTFRWPEISLLLVFDFEKFLAAAEAIPDLIVAVLQTWADAFAGLRFDPIFFLEGSRAMLSLNLFVAVLKPATAFIQRLMVPLTRLKTCVQDNNAVRPYRFADIAQLLSPEVEEQFIRGNFIIALFWALMYCVPCVRSWQSTSAPYRHPLPESRSLRFPLAELAERLENTAKNETQGARDDMAQARKDTRIYNRDVRKLGVRESELQQEITEQKRQLTLKQIDVDDLDKKKTKASSALEKSKHDHQQAHGDVERLKRATEDASRRKQDAAKQLRDARTAKDGADAKQREVEQRAQRLGEDVSAKQAALTTAERELSTAESDYGSAQRSLTTKVATVKTDETALTNAEKLVSDTGKKLSDLQREATDLQTRKAEADAQAGEATSTLKAATDALKILESSVTSKNTESDAAKAKVNRLTEEVSALNREATVAENNARPQLIDLEKKRKEAQQGVKEESPSWLNVVRAGVDEEKLKGFNDTLTEVTDQIERLNHDTASKRTAAEQKASENRRAQSDASDAETEYEKAVKSRTDKQADVTKAQEAVASQEQNVLSCQQQLEEAESAVNEAERKAASSSHVEALRGKSSASLEAKAAASRAVEERKSKMEQRETGRVAADQALQEAVEAEATATADEEAKKQARTVADTRAKEKKDALAEVEERIQSMESGEGAEETAKRRLDGVTATASTSNTQMAQANAHSQTMGAAAAKCERTLASAKERERIAKEALSTATAQLTAASAAVEKARPTHDEARAKLDETVLALPDDSDAALSPPPSPPPSSPPLLPPLSLPSPPPSPPLSAGPRDRANALLQTAQAKADASRIAKAAASEAKVLASTALKRCETEAADAEREAATAEQAATAAIEAEAAAVADETAKQQAKDEADRQAQAATKELAKAEERLERMKSGEGEEEKAKGHLDAVTAISEAFTETAENARRAAETARADYERCLAEATLARETLANVKEELDRACQLEEKNVAEANRKRLHDIDSKEKKEKKEKNLADASQVIMRAATLEAERPCLEPDARDGCLCALAFSGA